LEVHAVSRNWTGERIRDKIAASKARGIWMGGNLPLGYDVKDRKLRIIEDEAELIRHIFTRYLDLGSVVPLVKELDAAGKRTKRWTSSKGNVLGGTRFSVGALYHILSNRIYTGEIVHKGKAYVGEHPAIIAPELFDAVQSKLSTNRVKRVKRKERATASPLAGKLFDSDNLPMRPTFGHGRGKRIYRYYVSETLLPIGKSANDHNRTGSRLSASRIERLLGTILLPLMPSGSDAEAVFRAISRIRVKEACLRIRLQLSALLGEDEIDNDVLGRARRIDPAAAIDGSDLIITINGMLAKRGRSLFGSNQTIDNSERQRLLVDLIRKAHRQLQKLCASPLRPDDHSHMIAPNNEWGRQRVAVGLLAPDIQKALLQGKAPPHITPDLLLSADIPMDWSEQRRMLGITK
jgi:site-specific DNA recombinase